MGQSPDGSTILDDNENGIEFHQGKIFFQDTYIGESNKNTIAPKKIAPENSILMCVRAPVGDVNITNRDVAIGRGLCAIKPNSGVYLKYLFYCLVLEKKELEKHSTGSTFNSITVEVVRNINVSLPNYATQIKISNFIDKVFEKIDVIKTEKEKLHILINHTKSKILDYYFGDDSCYKSYYPSVPLKNICTLEKYNNSNNGNLPYLEAKVIRGTKTPIIKDIGVFVSKGTRIILVDGENSGEIMIVPCDGYMGSTFRVLNSNDSLIDKDYLSFFILYNKKALKDNKTGSAIPHLNKKIFNSLNVILPPLDIQQEFARKIFKLFDIINKIS